MKFLIVLVSFASINVFALTENWSEVSCAVSASRYLSHQFTNGPYTLPTRLDLYRTADGLEMILKSETGIIKKDTSLIQVESNNSQIYAYQSKRHVVEIGYIGKVKTEVKVFKNTSRKDLLAHFLCSSI